MNTSWERLEALIDSTSLSINAFAKSIGLKRAEVLYRIRSGKNAISKELADTITTQYCNISKAWLLTGEGTMFLGDEDKTAIEHYKIPFYNVISTSIISAEEDKTNTLKPLYYIDVPGMVNCDFAALFFGSSMAPEIPSGSIVTLKEIHLASVLPGEMYMIVTDQYTTIKYLRAVENDHSKIRLVPQNIVDYDEILMDKSTIKRLFLVKGVISTKVL